MDINELKTALKEHLYINPRPAKYDEILKGGCGSELVLYWLDDKKEFENRKDKFEYLNYSEKSTILAVSEWRVDVF